MKEKVKSFRLDEETIKKFETIKEKYRTNTDVDTLIRMINDFYDLQLNILVPIEILNQKEDEMKKLQDEIRVLYTKCGELQGELNIYKQQALPKKSFWKRLFGG